MQSENTIQFDGIRGKVGAIQGSRGLELTEKWSKTCLYSKFNNNNTEAKCTGFSPHHYFVIDS